MPSRPCRSMRRLAPTRACGPRRDEVTAPRAPILRRRWAFPRRRADQKESWLGLREIKVSEAGRSYPLPRRPPASSRHSTDRVHQLIELVALIADIAGCEGLGNAV